MKGVNKVILVGQLGQDPESKSFANGGSVCNFSIAISESWKDKNTGEQKQNTEWVRIVANGKFGEICQQYLKKGSKVYLEGALKTRQWQDQNGQDRYVTEVRISEMQMLDSKPQQQQAQLQQTNSYAKPNPKPQNNVDLDSDLPF